MSLLFGLLTLGLHLTTESDHLIWPIMALFLTAALCIGWELFDEHATYLEQGMTLIGIILFLINGLLFF